MQAYTHKGWMAFCPVYLGNLEDEAAPLLIEARHWALYPLFWLAEHVEILRISLSSIIWPDYEPLWMVRVTGELPHDNDTQGG